MTTFLIENKNISEFQIVIPTSATECENKSALELQRYLKKATGVSLTLTAKKTSCPSIFVGAEFAKDFPEFEQIKDDGFLIKVEKDAVYLAGKVDRGTLYAVYDLLERFGWRFFTHDSNVHGLEWASYMYAVEKLLTEGETVDLGSFVKVDNPGLFYRDGYGYNTVNADWCAKNRFNAKTWDTRVLPPELGGALFMSGDSGHSFRNLVPVSEWGESHPEFFAEIDGKRLNYGVGWNDAPQLCMTNDDLIPVIVQKVREIMKKHPGGYAVSVSQNDNNLFCQCEKCKKAMEELGGLGGLLMNFVNKVAEALEPEFPDLKIHTYAYWNTSKLPENFKLHKNVMLQYCLRTCRSHALSDEKCRINARINKEMQKLGKICNNLFIYDYRGCLGYAMLNFPDIDTLLPTMRALADANVKGIYSEMAMFTHNATTFEELRAYLYGKIMWNPYMSVEEYDRHENEFLEGYYGKGWKYMREALDYWNEVTNACHLDSFNAVMAGDDGKVVRDENGKTVRATLVPKEKTKEVVNRIYELFDKAKALANGAEQTRIEIARTGYIWYELFHTMKEEISKSEEKKAEYTARCKDLCSRMRLYAIKYATYIGMNNTQYMYDDFSLPVSDWKYFGAVGEGEIFNLGV